MAIGWRLYALYVCAMGTLAVSTVLATYALSESIWYAATASAEDAPRSLSRVEKFYAAKAAAWNNARPAPEAKVVALLKPDIHPAALAAAIDRTELASASEHPQRHATVLRVATNRDVPGAQVAGLACSVDGCDATDDTRLTGHAAEARVASSEIDAEQIAYAISDEASAEAAAAALQKPSKLGKGRAATARQKQQRKLLSQDGSDTSVEKFFPYQSGDRGVRVAETPGDIIRLSLLRGTI